MRDITNKGIDPIAYRFWLLMANYRTRVNFVWEALEGAETALKRLYRLYIELGEDIGQIDNKYQQKFKEYLGDDLDTPRALSILWDLVKDESISNADKKATILDFDKVFGLGFADLKKENIPAKIIELGQRREEARNKKDWEQSDRIREQIAKEGYDTEDTSSGPKFSRT